MWIIQNLYWYNFVKRNRTVIHIWFHFQERSSYFDVVKMILYREENCKNSNTRKNIRNFFSRSDPPSFWRLKFPLHSDSLQFVLQFFPHYLIEFWILNDENLKIPTFNKMVRKENERIVQRDLRSRCEEKFQSSGPQGIFRFSHEKNFLTFCTRVWILTIRVLGFPPAIWCEIILKEDKFTTFKVQASCFKMRPSRSLI